MLDLSWDDTPMEDAPVTSAEEVHEPIVEASALEEPQPEMVEDNTVQQELFQDEPLPDDETSAPTIETEPPKPEAVVEPAPEPPEPPKPQPAPSTGFTPIDITESPKTIAETIVYLKERSHLTTKQLSEKVHIPQSFIDCLEFRNYTKLIKNDEISFHAILQNLKTICLAMRADDTIVEKLREMLSKELREDGLEFSEGWQRNATTNVISDTESFERSMKRSRILLNYIPKILLIVVIVVFAAALIFSLILPKIGGNGNSTYEINFGPLVQPTQNKPAKLAVPTKL